MGKRRSIMTTVPAHGDLSPRARIYFFVFVVHTMSIMAGAMQFSARGGVDISVVMPVSAFSPSIKSYSSAFHGPVGAYVYIYIYIRHITRSRILHTLVNRQYLCVDTLIKWRHALEAQGLP